jgi:hypothetical protein
VIFCWFQFGIFTEWKLHSELINMSICFRIKGKLEEQRPERVKPFMTGAAEQIKHILANFKNYQVNNFKIFGSKDCIILTEQNMSYLMSL